jgi:ribosome-associated protein
MIRVTEDIEIDDSEIQMDFVRASGPGGQNVNKTSTAVQLRFDVGHSPALSEDVRERLTRLAGQRITKDGVLVIDARQFRTQERNRRAAIERLTELIRKAAQKPKRRRKTRPTPASQRRRLAAKRRRSEIKRLRRSTPRSDD